MTKKICQNTECENEVRGFRINFCCRACKSAFIREQEENGIPKFNKEDLIKDLNSRRR